MALATRANAAHTCYPPVGPAYGSRGILAGSPPCMHRSTAANGAERCCPWESSCRLGEQLGLPMTVSRPDEKTLVEAFSIIEDTPNIDGVVIKLRDLLRVDHVVYHSSKLGASPSDPQRGPYIRL